MANFTLPSFPRSPRPTPPRDALAAAVAELKARLDAASVSFPRLSSAAALHLVDSHADALALAASLADGDVVLVGGTSWYYVESHALAPFDPSGADARLAALEAKVPPAASPSNQLADKAYIATALAAIVGGAPEAYDTLKEIADWIADDESGAAKIVADVLALQARKQDLIADLEAIRAGAAKGATAVQDVSGKRDKTDFSVGDGWLLVKPDGTQVWLDKPDPQQSTWIGDGFALACETTEAYWTLTKVDETSGVLVVDDSDDSPPDANKLKFLGTDATSVYRLVRGSRLALDTEIPPVDDTVTRTSENPVKSSGIWTAIWGALSALPTGFASLYDWCVAQLEGKLSTSGGTMTGRISALHASLKWSTDPTFARFTIPGATNEHYMCFGYKDNNFGLFVKNGSGSAERFYALPSSGGDIAMIQDLAGKADSADLRYRIAEAAVRKTLPADCFPVTFTYEGVSYSVNSLVKESEASAAGDMFISVDETGCYLMMVESPAMGSEKASVIEVAYFDAGGVFVSGVEDLQFGGVSPVADTSPTLADVLVLADRTVNLIAATDETSVDIELPAAAHVGRMRDFYVRLTVSATSASTWTIGQGESWDAMGAPPSSFAPGTYLYHISEVAAGVWHCEDLFGVLNRIPMYQVVGVTPSSGTLTVSPYTVATYTAGDSSAAFTVAVGTGTSGKARDCELVIDCTATGAVAPTVTWPATFHPRTDAATDFACEAGKRNVYFISEFATGEFAVGGWKETAGGNA